MRYLQQVKREVTSTRTLFTEPIPSSETLSETNVSAINQNHETSLMVNSNESHERPMIAVDGNIDHTNQEAQSTNTGNPNTITVSVLSPEKRDYLSDKPENTLGSLDKRPSSNPSSRSSRNRLEMEAKILEDQAIVEIEKKELEIEFRRKKREVEAKSYEMDLAEVKRQQATLLKMKKMKVMDQKSSKCSVSSAGGSHRFRHRKTRSWVTSQENKFDSTKKTHSMISQHSLSTMNHLAPRSKRIVE